MKLPCSEMIGCFVVLLLLQCIYPGDSQRLRDSMYEPITGANCIRRLNGTHQTGCSSETFGSVGALHLINIEEDFDFLVNNPPAPPYAPMIPPHLFTRKQLLRLKNEAGPNVSAVLIINRTVPMEKFSQELPCPNYYSGIRTSNGTASATCDADGAPSQMWNPWGTGLLHEDFPFPIFYIADEQEIDKLVKCFETFNNFNYTEHVVRSLCAIEINSFMSAAVNTEVCMRRTNFLNNLNHIKYCDPLEGRNIYGTLFPRTSFAATDNENDVKSNERKIDETERFILVSCRIDTTSMFDGVGLGMLDSLLSYVTLTSVAQTLAQLLPTQKPGQTNVLFMVFNGESYDYIGSQRLVYDMEKLEFPPPQNLRGPIALSQIDLMLDLGVLDDITKLQLHSLSALSATGQKLLQSLNSYAKTYSFGMQIASAEGLHLPPTSAQSFLRRNQSFPALVLNSQPTNQFYHSIYDDEHNANYTYANTSVDFTGLMEANDAFKYFDNNMVQMRVRNVSTVLALALYETISGTAYSGSKIANPLWADELFYCFLISADCALFKAASAPKSLPGVPMPPPSRYISVFGGPQEAAGWTYRVLGLALSQPQANISKEHCSPLPLNYLAGYSGKGSCRLTTQNYSYALSPAFLIDDYNWTSGEYSTWSESTWRQFSARIFLRPSKVHEYTTFSIGTTMLILSFCLVYIISRRSDVLFDQTPSVAA